MEDRLVAGVKMPILPRDHSHIGPYLEAFYDRLTEENVDIGTFIAEATAGNPRNFSPRRMLDAGCGPTMLYWAAFARDVDEIHGLDVQAEHIDHVQKETEAGMCGVMPHGRYLDLYTHAGALSMPPKPALVQFQETCGKVRTLVAADMEKQWPYPDASFELVLNAFGIECVDSMDLFRAGLREVRRVLRPGGRYVLVSLAETTTWNIFETTLRCLFLTEKMVRDELFAAGFTNVSVRKHAATTAIERNQGYANMLFAIADR